MATFDYVLTASPRARGTPTVRVVGSDARMVAALCAAGWRVRREGHADAVVLLAANPSRIRDERAQGAGALVVVADLDLDGRLAALAAGADDVLHPGAAGHELAARLHLLLGANRRLLAADDLQIDLGSRTATRGGRVLDLTPLELELLAFLLRNRGIVVSRATIAENVWSDRPLPASE